MLLKPSFSPQIKHIIFDFGAVLYDIDYQRTVKAFQNLGLDNFDVLFSKAAQTNLFDRLETGNIEKEQFIEEIRSVCGKDLAGSDIVSAWNAILIGLPDEKLRLVESVKKNYGTYLLSNTNIFHAEAFLAEIDERFGKERFYKAFNHVYLSHELHLRKPDPEIFLYVLKNNGLSPKETLFIDDSPQHIATAQKMGVFTHHLKDGEDVSGLFNNE